MSSTPPGYSTIGPIYERERTKELFRDACNKEGKTMEGKLKELILSAVNVHFPEYQPEKIPGPADEKIK